MAQFLDYVTGYDPKNYVKTPEQRQELLRARQREYDDLPNEKRMWKKKLLKKQRKYPKKNFMVN